MLRKHFITEKKFKKKSGDVNDEANFSLFFCFKRELNPYTPLSIKRRCLSHSLSWLGQLGTRHDDDEAFRRGERMGRVGFDFRIFFPGWQVTRVSPYVRGPFPSKEIRRISERDDLGQPFVPGSQEIGLGSRNLERAGR